MATQRIVHGATIQTATPDEIKALLDAMRTPEQFLRIRAAETVILDATGAGQDNIYKVPAGMEFAVRRVSVNLNTASDPSTGNVPLNVAGKFLAYYRGGTFIEYAAPESPNPVPQIPGVQTWGDQEGPYLRNGEVFQVVAVGLTANATLDITVEGILRDPQKWERK